MKDHFFLNIEDGKLIRKWTGSTFGFPYKKVYFLDKNLDQKDYIFIICQEGEKEVIRGYYWFNFGFIYIGESEKFDKVENIYTKNKEVYADIKEKGKNEKLLLDISSGESIKSKKIN